MARKKCHCEITNRNIHSKILIRLVITWLVLSCLLGSLVLFFQIRNIDRLVLDSALKNASELTIECVNHVSANGSHGHEPLKREIQKSFDRGFLAIKVFNRNKEMVVEEFAPGKEALTRSIGPLTSKLPMTGAVEHHMFIMDWRLYIQIMIPLKDARGADVGYFEGVYQVADDNWHNIKSSVAHILMTVMAVILVTTAALYPIIILLDRDIVKFSTDVLRGNIELMETLGSAIAKRDSETSVHNYRVTIYAIRLAEELKLDNDAITDIIAGAFLHDVGKIGISDNILLKPGKLTSEEFEIMKTHVLLGLDILRKSEWLKNGQDVVEYHHEKYDGSGYMKGLAGKSIPLAARIFAIVDVFDALTSKRPYKEPFGFEAAMDIMRKSRGSHFDPNIFDHFERLAEQMHNEISSADDTAVAGMLDGLIEKHFFDSRSLRRPEYGSVSFVSSSPTAG